MSLNVLKALVQQGKNPNLEQLGISSRISSGSKRELLSKAIETRLSEVPSEGAQHSILEMFRMIPSLIPDDSETEILVGEIEQLTSIYRRLQGEN